MKNSMRSVSAVNSVAMENMGDKHTSQYSHREATLQIDTLCCQRKDLEHKGGQAQIMYLHFVTIFAKYVKRIV